ncbi:MAG: hypothetical protein LBD93_03330 [Treponema sp.]|nr:hypothetical protein [Treponema sp.]
MVFNSWQFLVFFPVVTVLYFILTMKLHQPPRSQVFLLIASLFFYGYWNPWYLGLILFSVLITWVGALLIEKIEKIEARKGGGIPQEDIQKNNELRKEANRLGKQYNRKKAKYDAGRFKTLAKLYAEEAEQQVVNGDLLTEGKPELKLVKSVKKYSLFK